MVVSLLVAGVVVVMVAVVTGEVDALNILTVPDAGCDIQIGTVLIIHHQIGIILFILRPHSLLLEPFY